MHTSKVSATQNSELSLFDEVDKTTPPQTVAEVTVINQQEVLGKDFKIYGTFENPLFLAKDVAEWIEYSKTSKGAFDVSNMLKNIDEDEKEVRTIFVSDVSDSNNVRTTSKARKSQGMWFLTENGLYEVLMLSRKPIAKEFKKEVKRILHDLRVGKTQIAYNIPKTLSEALRLAADQAEQIEAQQKLLDVQQPKVELHDKALTADGTYSMDQVASLLKLPYGNVTLFKKLRELGILCKDNTPAQSQENAGRFIVVTKTIAKGDKAENVTVTRVTYKGVEYIAKKLGVIHTPKTTLTNKQIAEYRAKIADKSYMTKTIESVATEMADNEIACREVE